MEKGEERRKPRQRQSRTRRRDEDWKSIAMSNDSKGSSSPGNFDSLRPCKHLITRYLRDYELSYYFSNGHHAKQRVITPSGRPADGPSSSTISFLARCWDPRVDGQATEGCFAQALVSAQMATKSSLSMLLGCAVVLWIRLQGTDRYLHCREWWECPRLNSTCYFAHTDPRTPFHRAISRFDWKSTAAFTFRFHLGHGRTNARRGDGWPYPKFTIGVAARTRHLGSKTVWQVCEA